MGLVLALIVAQDTHLPHKIEAAGGDPLFCQRVLQFTGIMVVLTTLLNAASLEKVLDG